MGANTLVKDLEKSWDEIDQALKALRADPPKLTDCKHITRFFAGHAIWVIPAIIGIGSLCGSEHSKALFAFILTSILLFKQRAARTAL